MRAPALKVVRLSALMGTVFVAACGTAEPTTVESVRADMPGHMEGLYEIKGEVVRPDSRILYVAIGAQYFTVEDPTGRLNVWYGVGVDCPPRIGSEVVVAGRVVKPDGSSPHVFTARKISIESSPPSGEDEVRLCELSLKESEIYQTQGEEALQEYWRSRGEPVRRVTTS